MTPEEFRQVGYQIVDWIAEYREQLGDLPVMSTVSPGEVRDKLASSPPQQAEPFTDILNDFQQIIMPGISHWNHPGNFAYFPGNNSHASIIGDMLSSGLGVIGLNWQSSPALTEVEELVTDWMQQMMGLSEEWQGVIQDSASISSLVALLCARERVTGHCQNQGGLQDEATPLVVYCSSESHSSVLKGALLAGFGRNNVRSIAIDENFAMRVELLEQAIDADIVAGRRPTAIVATVGTTASTAIDSVADITKLSRRHNIWLHVDAAMAGSAMILPECRWQWAGVEAADSLVMNPHKWLGAGFDCSLYYVRDSAHLIRVMSTNPSYLKTSVDNEAKNYRDWGIPLGRRFRALKLWCLIREQGVAGLQARLRRDIANANWLKEKVESAPDWQLVAPVPLQTLCVRHIPAGIAENSDALDVHTLAWANYINQSGVAYLTPAKLNGHWIVRISIGTESTTREHVEQLWHHIQKAVDLVS